MGVGIVFATGVPAHGANAESVILPENGQIEEWNAV
jgi:hypothetical protein